MTPTHKNASKNWIIIKRMNVEEVQNFYSIFETNKQKKNMLKSVMSLKSISITLVIWSYQRVCEECTVYQGIDPKGKYRKASLNIRYKYHITKLQKLTHYTNLF